MVARNTIYLYVHIYIYYIYIINIYNIIYIYSKDSQVRLFFACGINMPFSDGSVSSGILRSFASAAQLHVLVGAGLEFETSHGRTIQRRVSKGQTLPNWENNGKHIGVS